MNELIDKLPHWTQRGCSDHSCIIKKPTGMGTNGGCQYLKTKDTLDLKRIIRVLYQENRRLKKELADWQRAHQELSDEWSDRC